MFVLNLDQMKVVKEYHADERGAQIHANIMTQSCQALRTAAAEAVSSVLKDCSRTTAHHFVFDLPGEGAASMEDAEAFASATNVILAEFFRAITLTNHRKREYRLDVPERLMEVHAPRNLLKRAVNNETLIELFTITINYKDMFFEMCDNPVAEGDVIDA